MKLFRKHLTPEQLGAAIYEHLRAHLASDDELSISTLLRNIERLEETLPEQHQGAIMVGTMFGATMAIERSTGRWVSRRVIQGMHNEFFNHIREQGASFAQVKDWEKIVLDQGEQYRAAMEGFEEELEPPWKLGRLFLWNIIGEEEYVATQIKSATLFLLAARDAAQSLMNKYGPSLVIDVSL
jgi:hypothetical protein